MMSRSWSIPWLVALSACGGPPLGAQAPSAVAATTRERVHLYEVAEGQVAGKTQDAGFVEVSGAGAVTVAPDRAVVTFAVETRERSAGSASAANADAMARVASALRAAGPGGLTIETYGYALQPVYGTTDASGRRIRVIEGYTAVNNVRVGTDDVEAVGSLLDVAIEAGANRVSGLSFMASDTDAAEHEALSRAVRRAREQAATMAEALGRELGPALEVRGGSAPAGPRPDRGFMRAEAAGQTTPIEATDQVVRANVTIRFALGAVRGGG